MFLAISNATQHLPGVIHMMVMKMVTPVAKLARGVLALHGAEGGAGCYR